MFFLQPGMMSTVPVTLVQGAHHATKVMGPTSLMGDQPSPASFPKKGKLGKRFGRKVSEHEYPQKSK